MGKNFVPCRPGLLRPVAVFFTSACLGLAGEVSLVKTNHLDRWITNLIEVSIPANHFVNEYHTNRIEVIRTNVLDQYCTNWVSRSVTNRVWVDVFRTNFVEAYQTNHRTLAITNLVQMYRTNLNTVNLTNWATILVFKTNWITQQLTNTVEVNLPKRESASTESIHPRAAEGPAGPLTLEAENKGLVTRNNQVEVRLTVRWASDATAPLQIQQWRIEREDGSILCFGQDQEFRRALPAGKYKVQVKAQRNEKGPLLAALGTLAVSPTDIVLQQKPSPAKEAL